MINILIRTSYRKELFQRLILSIQSQTYTNLRILVSYDDDRALEYIPEYCETVRVYKDHSRVHYFDDYVNTLKTMVTDGYFVVIDDDDYLTHPEVLEQIAQHLKSTSGLVCQFSRAGRLKPSLDLIRRRQVVINKIGMPCLFLHHSHKDLVDLDGSEYGADYTWIKKVSEKVALKFVAIPVVYADRRSRGVMS